MVKGIIEVICELRLLTSLYFTSPRHAYTVIIINAFGSVLKPSGLSIPDLVTVLFEL